MTLTAIKSKPVPTPYLEHVAGCMAEVMPAVMAWKESAGKLERLTLESRLSDLEHACRLARRAL